MQDKQIEKHPLQPFFPENAEWLFLGSFPPKQNRWSMDFFYPNFQNDMWRIFGLVFFKNKNYFVDIKEKRFQKEKIINFLKEKKIAMYDTAEEVIRHKDNASDKDLEIVTPLDIIQTISQLDNLQNIVTTGQKATDTLIEQLTQNNIDIKPPNVGNHTTFYLKNRMLYLHRMPSSSRAYPLSLEKKAETYARMFTV
jgi:G:T/U-mismatch repair DNA glycosylase